MFLNKEANSWLREDGHLVSSLGGETKKFVDLVPHFVTIKSAATGGVNLPLLKRGLYSNKAQAVIACLVPGNLFL